MVLRIGSRARAEGPLNELGSKGWQLVQAVEMEGHLAFYLEREISPPSAQPPPADVDEAPAEPEVEEPSAEPEAQPAS